MEDSELAELVCYHMGRLDEPMRTNVFEVVKAVNNAAVAAEVEVERLRAVLEKLQAWANAYPLTVFPEPDFAKAHDLLQAGGMTLDAISASNMRHVIDGVRKLVDEGLRPNVRVEGPDAPADGPARTTS